MELIQSRILSGIAGLRHGFFSPGTARNIGDNLSYKNAPQDVVWKARQKACQIIDIPAEHLTHVYQEHGTVIWPVGREHRGAGALTGDNPVGNGDGLISAEPGVPLAILIADCLPIFFSTVDTRTIGLVHAGWRGTLNDIVGVTVDKMDELYRVGPSSLVVWIGPGISKNGFRVGNDVWQLFQERWGEYDDCFDREKQSIDLKKINRYQLEIAGVLTDNIEVAEECTFGDYRFFSYRRDGKGSGHNMAVIMKER